MSGPQRNVDYARRSMCRAFAQGKCTRQACSFSHTLIDPTRLLQLVGDVGSYGLTHAHSVTQPPAYLILEFSVRDRPLDSGKWTVKLCHGGRVSLRGEGWTIDRQPAYPREATANNLLEAVTKLERKLFGRTVPVSWKAGDPGVTLCKSLADGQRASCKCRNSHDLVDFSSIEALVVDISKKTQGSLTTSEPPTIRIAYLKSHRADFIWHVTEPGARDQSENVVEASRLTTALKALKTRLEARNVLSWVAPQDSVGSSSQQRHTTAGGTTAARRSTATTEPTTNPEVQQEAPPPYSELPPSGPHRSPSPTTVAPTVTPQSSTRLLLSAVPSYHSVVSSPSPSPAATSSSSASGSATVVQKPTPLEVSVKVKATPRSWARQPSSSNVKSSHTITAPSAVIQVDVGVKTKPTPSFSTPSPFANQVSKPPAAAVKAEVKAKVKAGTGSRCSHTTSSACSSSSSERQPLLSSAASHVTLPSKPPASCAATVDRHSQYRAVSYSSVDVRGTLTESSARVQQWVWTLPPRATAPPADSRRRTFLKAAASFTVIVFTASFTVTVFTMLARIAVFALLVLAVAAVVRFVWKALATFSIVITEACIAIFLAIWGWVFSVCIAIVQAIAGLLALAAMAAMVYAGGLPVLALFCCYMCLGA